MQTRKHVKVTNVKVHTRTRHVVRAFLALSIAACDNADLTRPQTNPARQAAAPSAASLPLDLKGAPVDQQYRAVGTKVPEFGGFFVDASGAPHAVLLRAEALPALKSAMSSVYGAKFDKRFSSRTWVVVPGQYGYIQLADWRDQILPTLFAVEGVTKLGIDHTRIG